MTTLIIPTFNRLNFLVPTLYCLLQQRSTGDEFEVVVVDSGSDGTEKYVHSLSNRTKLIRYHKIPEIRNRSLLRNEGAKIANGTLLVFIDNDMLVPSTFLQTHVALHEGKDRNVVLGKRRSLVEFDQRKLDMDFLSRDFARIENLPFYYDYRDQFFATPDQTLETVNTPWRFCFSHSFSVKRQLFEQVGGFNEDFGVNWGFEDVELGLRLHQSGAQFIFETECPSYHQPHVEQSRNEQPLSTMNAQLMSKLYPSVEIELLNVFGTPMGKYLDELPLEKIPDQGDSERAAEVPRPQEIVLANLARLSGLQKPPASHHLGIYLHAIATNSVRSIRVLPAYHKLSPLFQAGILREAFRVSEIAKFEGSTDETAIRLRKLSKKMGISLSIRENGTATIAQRTAIGLSHVLTLILPSPTDPKRRFAWLALSLELGERGFEVVILDPKGKRDFAQEDYQMGTTDLCHLEEKLNNPFSYLSDRQVFSEENILMGIVGPQPPNKMVISDIGFPKLGVCPVVQTLPGAMTIADDVLVLAQAARLSPQTDHRGKTSSPNELHFLCTMSSGFDEDGIKEILEAFEELNAKFPYATLTIKSPNIPEIASACFTEHNDQSRKYKLQGPLRKAEFDHLRLERSVGLNKASSSILIVRKNCSIHEMLNLLEESDCFISASRGIAICADIISALSKGIAIVLPEHIRLPSFASEAQNVKTYSSQKSSFSDVFNIPETSATLKLQAYRPSVTALLSMLEEVARDSPLARLSAPVDWHSVRQSLDEKVKSAFGVSRWD